MSNIRTDRKIAVDLLIQPQNRHRTSAPERLIFECDNYLEIR